LPNRNNRIQDIPSKPRGWKVGKNLTQFSVAHPHKKNGKIKKRPGETKQIKYLKLIEAQTLTHVNMAGVTLIETKIDGEALVAATN